MISQPRLGQKLHSTRKEKGLTQEDLVELCHVSVRTIQRIESGEVTPRFSTVKILLAALGQDPKSWAKDSQEEEGNNGKINFFNTMLIIDLPSHEIHKSISIAWIAGIIYMVLGAAEIGAELMVFDRINSDIQLGYATIKILAGLSFFIFNRGFIALAQLFENSLLKQASYVLAFGVSGLYLTDIFFIYAFPHDDTAYEVYTAFYLLAVGAMTLVFGVGLLRLQDSMGQLSKVTGILTIIMGIAFLTIIFSFIGVILLAPIMVLQILLLIQADDLGKRDNSAIST